MPAAPDLVEPDPGSRAAAGAAGHRAARGLDWPNEKIEQLQPPANVRKQKLLSGPHPPAAIFR